MGIHRGIQHNGECAQSAFHVHISPASSTTYIGTSHKHHVEGCIACS